MKTVFFLFFTFLLNTPNLIAQNTKEVMQIDYDLYLNINNSNHFNSSLYVSRAEMLFMWGNGDILEEKKDPEVEVDEATGKYKMSMKMNLDKSDSIGSYDYINHLKDSIYSRRQLLGKVYQAREKKPAIKWEILNETKKIVNFTCQKAKAIFRGRTYYAWFTTELPFTASPWKLHGLPGVVLQAFDKDRLIHFVFKSIRKVEIGDVFKIIDEKCEIVSFKEYLKIEKSMLGKIKGALKKIASKMPRQSDVVINSKVRRLEIFDKE